MVCRLCGAANPDQQASCTVCGSPLERQLERRRFGRPGKRKVGRFIWLGLCLVVGAGLGWALIHARAPQARAGLAIAVSASGAVIGIALGGVPRSVIGNLRRAWFYLVFHFLNWLTHRRRAFIQRQCEGLLQDNADDAETNVRLACVMWLEGRRPQAEEVLRRALSGKNPLAIARHNMAVIDAVSGRRTRAAEILESVRDQFDTTFVFFWNLGLARWGLRKYVEAAEAFREATRLESKHLKAHHALALMAALQGETGEAIGQLESLLRINRHDADILCSLGMLQQFSNDLAAAEFYFTQALRAQPAQIGARYNRALCAMLEGRHYAALDDLSRLNRIAPEYARGYSQKGVCWYRLGKTQQAIRAVRQSLHGQPTDFQVRYNAGTLLLRENHLEPAIHELEKAYEIAPRDPEVVLNLGVGMYLCELPRQALDHFRLAVRMNEKHALARYNCAAVYTALDLLKEAEAELDALLELYPDFPEAFNEIGVVYLRNKRLIEAAGQFRRAADAMPRSAPVRANLALVYCLQGDFAASLEQARFAVAVDPKLAAGREIAGRVAMEMREIKEACAHFEALVKLEPTNPDAHANLGLSYYKDDRLNDAIESYKRMLIFAPNSPEGHNDLGLAYAKHKMIDEAIQHLVKVIEWRPDNPIVHSNLGLVYYFKGESENAVERWREVTRISPQYARKREATQYSAYDDQEMRMPPLDLRKRSSHYPLKVAAFRHSFQISQDENDYQMALPWPDLAAAARRQQRAQRARQRMAKV